MNKKLNKWVNRVSKFLDYCVNMFDLKPKDFEIEHFYSYDTNSDVFFIDIPYQKLVKKCGDINSAIQMIGNKFYNTDYLIPGAHSIPDDLIRRIHGRI